MQLAHGVPLLGGGPVQPTNQAVMLSFSFMHGSADGCLGTIDPGDDAELSVYKLRHGHPTLAYVRETSVHWRHA